ncbi:ornithine cyclodeaminase family protein [Herbaspirillum sp. RTI4]|nr:ornithine cyclodeaminase family protein [Herbaspirillum sp. RTI4]
MSKVDFSLTEILYAIDAAYKAYSAGLSDNPRKLTTNGKDGRSVSYAMLGRDGQRGTIGLKSSYKFHGNPGKNGQNGQKYYTSLLLFDDATGLPLALMDCSLVGGLRTPAASALIARECAQRNAECALVIGCGTQGQMALPFLATAMPQLKRLIVHGRHTEGVNAVVEKMKRFHPNRTVEVSTNLRAEAGVADIIIGAAGPRSLARVQHDWLKPGALSILVGYGLHPDLLHKADYRIATNEAQMQITGADLVDSDGKLPAVDAELPDILSGSQSGRHDQDQRIFAYNSGMVITDIALGRLFVERASAQGLGRTVQMW